MPKENYNDPNILVYTPDTKSDEDGFIDLLFGQRKQLSYSEKQRAHIGRQDHVAANRIKKDKIKEIKEERQFWKKLTFNRSVLKSQEAIKGMIAFPMSFKAGKTTVAFPIGEALITFSYKYIKPESN